MPCKTCAALAAYKSRKRPTTMLHQFYEGEKFVLLGPIGLTKEQQEEREKFLKEFKEQHPDEEDDE